MPRWGSYFLLLAQKKCNQRKGHPGSPVARWATPLRCSPRRASGSNSRDPLRGHALRQSPLPPARLHYSAARRGPKSVAVPTVSLRFTLCSTTVSNRVLCSAGFQPASTETKCPRNWYCAEWESAGAMRFAYCTLRTNRCFERIIPPWQPNSSTSNHPAGSRIPSPCSISASAPFSCSPRCFR